MIIAISSTGIDIDSDIYNKFERCSFFLIVDLEQNTLLPIKNKSKNRPHEIGGSIGHLISKHGVDAIITTDIGPSSFNIFKENKIKIYQPNGNVEDAIQQFRLGELRELKKATTSRYLDWKKNKIGGD